MVLYYNLIFFYNSGNKWNNARLQVCLLNSIMTLAFCIQTPNSLVRYLSLEGTWFYNTDNDLEVVYISPVITKRGVLLISDHFFFFFSTACIASFLNLLTKLLLPITNRDGKQVFFVRSLLFAGANWAYLNDNVLCKNKLLIISVLTFLKYGLNFFQEMKYNK